MLTGRPHAQPCSDLGRWEMPFVISKLIISWRNVSQDLMSPVSDRAAACTCCTAGAGPPCPGWEWCFLPVLASTGRQGGWSSGPGLSGFGEWWVGREAGDRSHPHPQSGYKGHRPKAQPAACPCAPRHSPCSATEALPAVPPGLLLRLWGLPCLSMKSVFPGTWLRCWPCPSHRRTLPCCHGGLTEVFRKGWACQSLAPTCRPTVPTAAACTYNLRGALGSLSWCPPPGPGGWTPGHLCRAGPWFPGVALAAAPFSHVERAEAQILSLERGVWGCPFRGGPCADKHAAGPCSHHPAGARRPVGPQAVQMKTLRHREAALPVQGVPARKWPGWEQTCPFCLTVAWGWAPWPRRLTRGGGPCSSPASCGPVESWECGCPCPSSQGCLWLWTDQSPWPPSAGTNTRDSSSAPAKPAPRHL